MYSVRGCLGVNPTVIVSFNNSGSLSHTVQNGPETPIEEDSAYNVSLIAMNDIGINSNIVSTTIRTSQAGMCNMLTLIAAT